MAFGWSLASAMLILSTGGEVVQEAMSYTAVQVSTAFQARLISALLQWIVLPVGFFFSLNLQYEWILLYLWGEQWCMQTRSVIKLQLNDSTTTKFRGTNRHATATEARRLDSQPGLKKLDREHPSSYVCSCETEWWRRGTRQNAGVREITWLGETSYSVPWWA